MVEEVNPESWLQTHIKDLERASQWDRYSLAYLVGVRAVLVLGPVRGVGEGLVAALVLAHVGLLPRVGAQVRLEVLQAGVGLEAALELRAQRNTVTG